jgi:hypothetical protein
VKKTLDALAETESRVVPRRNSAPASDTHNQEFDPSKYPVHAEHVENVSTQENDNMQEVQESPMVHEEPQRESVATLQARFEALVTEVNGRCDKLGDVRCHHSLEKCWKLALSFAISHSFQQLLTFMCQIHHEHNARELTPPFTIETLHSLTRLHIHLKLP